ncbi:MULTISPECIES: hypothetical protein [Salipiger]|jgi:hypothetical protein|uniref:Uncharacterized protein n=1 Tax=Salipiger thiooxidans TaxID=282683 RepID=A0A1G7DJI3_9RHOB|nr:MULTISPECIES: hypothetical protein [Salipiger]SDE51236.1 hypothetical protein SAMN04488105_104243 [Salipiger thiooxidans]
MNGLLHFLQTPWGIAASGGLWVVKAGVGYVLLRAWRARRPRG